MIMFSPFDITHTNLDNNNHDKFCIILEKQRWPSIRCHVTEEVIEEVENKSRSLAYGVLNTSS